jgi:LemA protein
MLEIIIGCGGFILLLILLIIIYHNKFQYVIIKIEEAENNISVLLDNKQELLNRARPIIKKELKLDEFLEELEKIENKGLNQFQMNSWLKDSYFDLVKLIDENEKLYKSESLVSILEELGDNEDMIVGSINYYNDSVVNFNKLVMSFPSKIVAFLFRYKKKEFHNNEKKEMYQILNEK